MCSGIWRYIAISFMPSQWILDIAFRLLSGQLRKPWSNRLCLQLRFINFGCNSDRDVCDWLPWYSVAFLNVLPKQPVVVHLVRLYNCELQHPCGRHRLRSGQRFYHLWLDVFDCLCDRLLRHSTKHFLPVKRFLDRSIRLYDCELFFHPYPDQLCDQFGSINLRINANGDMRNRLCRHGNKYHLSG